MSQSDEHLTLITDCENRESKLSDWERGFIDSVRNQIQKDRALTDKQVQTLETIWERVT